jgi:hypothetical protein
MLVENRKKAFRHLDRKVSDWYLGYFINSRNYDYNEIHNFCVTLDIGSMTLLPPRLTLDIRTL